MSGVRRVLISVGSNIDPEHNVPEGIAAVDRHEAVTLLAVGGHYESAPAGRPADPCFHNTALLVETTLEPAGLRAMLREVEAARGRVRSDDRDAPRPLDLDIAAYEGFEGEVEGTPVPNPEIGSRPHLALPLADVAPDWVLPGTGKTLRETAEVLGADGAAIRRLDVSGGAGADPAIARVGALLADLGIDPGVGDLRETPGRVAEALRFLTSGYRITVDEVVAGSIFDSDADEMVVVKGIEFYSLCEHHLLPFFGTVDVGYLPAGRIIGLGKIARIVDVFTRRLQVQERLTNQIADAIVAALDPKGVAIVMEASHLCMMMRGVQRQGTALVTSAMRRRFKSDARTRAEFIALIG